ncbi:hypothetical protein [Psychroserpens mesophilus]|uniref:hypothetical protein n=1 Tax=Psychroserpens mesophilus TaxID=325473 RepID=UPI003D65DE04
MKHFKLFLLSFIITAGFLTSCSNNDSVVEEQNIDQTEAITQSLNRLAQQFNDQGNVIQSENPSGNIVFDFCFDFVYPLNLAYNNGTTVTINGLDDLITILINSTDNLYINGVEFPFNVETYNDAAGAIEVLTINNEDEFFDLLENCDFEGADDCACFEVYDPVCVEVQAPDGESFIVTYPNECYAMCDGFTPNDFVDNCANDYNNPGGNTCFEFVFPLSIITDENQTVTVNSQEELDNALYNAYYFNFVYSFDVIINDEPLSIGNEEAFLELLEFCFNNANCPCPANVDPVCVAIQSPNGGTEIIEFLNACEAECEGFTTEDFVDCNTTEPCDCPTDEYDPVCVEINENGNTFIATFSNACFAECEGFSSADFIDCDVNNPTECSEQDVFAYLMECNWYINTSLYNNVNAEYAHFFQNGVVEITSEGSNQTIGGDWWLASNPSSTEVFMFFNITSEPYSMFSSLDWVVTECSEYFIVLQSGSEFIQLERDCD